jgi:hypothetical protein
MKLNIAKQKHNFLVKKHVILTLLISLSIYSAYSQFPHLGRSWSFSVFATVGAIDNTGNTFINNDMGTNAGAINGFPPGIVMGSVHNADSISNVVTTDINFLYNYLDNLSCDSSIGVGLGNNQILTPNVYCIGAASTLNDVLILDAQGNPDALFIFQIDGAFASTGLSQIILTNSAQPCNVFWQINGLVNLGANSFFLGTVVAAGAITMLNEAELEGRIFSIPGAINLNNNFINMPCSEVFLSKKNIQISSDCVDNKFAINWSGYFGENTSYFIVEKSNNNNEWQTIGRINVKKSNSIQTYRLIDYDSYNKSKYYRIIQHNIDRNTQIIGEIKNTPNCNSLDIDFQIFPNPTNSFFEIFINGDDALIENITIFNIFGKEVFTTNNYNRKIDIKHLVNGCYSIQIKYNNTVAYSKLIIN